MEERNIEVIINQRIAKLQQLRDLFQDPEVRQLARELLGTPPPAARPATPHNGHGLTATARQCLPTIPRDFLASDLISKMKSQGYTFGRDPNTAIQAVLKRFVKENLVKVSSPGKGRRATIYQRLEASPVEAPEVPEPAMDAA